MHTIPPDLEALLLPLHNLPHARHTVDPYVHTIGVVDRVDPRLRLVALCHDLGKIPEMDIGNGRYRDHAQRSIELVENLGILSQDELFLIEHHHVLHDLLNNVDRNHADPVRLLQRVQRRYTRQQLTDLFELTIADDWDLVDADDQIRRVKELQHLFV